MEAAQLVQQLGTDRRLDAMRSLVGGVTATELRSVTVSAEVLDALAAGLDDPNPKVRWWCIQLLDHIDDPRAVAVIARALDDPVPRVRRNAAHALGCIACKPTWDGTLSNATVERLHDMAEHDPNAKVRATAATALACQPNWG